MGSWDHGSGSHRDLGPWFLGPWETHPASIEASVSSPINGAEIRAPTPETAGGARSMLGAEAQPTPGQR